jgi:ribosomal protein L17
MDAFTKLVTYGQFVLQHVRTTSLSSIPTFEEWLCQQNNPPEARTVYHTVLQGLFHTLPSSAANSVPAPRLVGIETNPGPKPITEAKFQDTAKFLTKLNYDKKLTASELKDLRSRYAKLRKQRLVGVETNPGPLPLLLKGAGAAIASTLVPKLLRKNKTKGKNKNKNRSSALSNRMTSQIVTLPIRTGTIRTQAPRRHSVRTTVEAMLFIRADSQKRLAFSSVEDSSSFSQFALDIGPKQSPIVSSICPMGLPATFLANAFLRYQVHGMSLEWIPSQGSNSTGEVTFAYVNDPYTLSSTSTNYNFINLSQFDDAKTFPMFPSAKKYILTPKRLDREMKYVNVSSSDGSSQRFGFAGALLVRNYGLAFGDQTYGTVKITYDVEFSGISLNAYVTGPTSLDTAPETVQPVLDSTITSDPDSATEDEPFGIPNYLPFPTNYIPDASRIYPPLLGKYELTGSWTDITGAITGVPVVDTGSTTVFLLGYSAGDTAPYPVTVTFVQTTPAQRLALKGPPGMTAGKFVGSIRYLGQNP